MLAETLVKPFLISSYMDAPDNALIDTNLDTRAITEQLVLSLPEWQNKLVLFHPKRRAGDCSFTRAPRTKFNDMLGIGNTLLSQHLKVEATHLHPFKYRSIIESQVDANADLKNLFATHDVPNLLRLRTVEFMMKFCTEARCQFILPDDSTGLSYLAPQVKFYDQLDKDIIHIALSLYPAILNTSEAQMTSSSGGINSHKVDNWDLVYWSVYYNLPFTQYDWLLIEHLDQLCPLVRVMVKRMNKGHLLAYGRGWDEHHKALATSFDASTYQLDDIASLKRPAPIVIQSKVEDSPKGETLDPAELDTEIDLNNPTEPVPTPTIAPQDALYSMIHNLTLAQTDVLLKHFQLAINTLEAHKTALSNEVVLC